MEASGGTNRNALSVAKMVGRCREDTDLQKQKLAQIPRSVEVCATQGPQTDDSHTS